MKPLSDSFFQYSALALSFIITILDRGDEPWIWAEAALVYIGLLIVYWKWPLRYNYVYLAVQLLLVLAAVVLHPIGFMLGFSLAVSAMLIYPGRWGIAWIVFVALSTTVLINYFDNLNDLLVTLIGLILGYGSIGYAFWAGDTANEERRRSEALLAQLQQAHERLQDYSVQVQELAVSEERNRLAREMHDALGHRLTVSAVQLEAARRLIPSQPEQAAQMVGTVREQVGEALQELRRTVATLRAGLDEDLPLPTALRRLAEGFQAATGLPVILELPEHLDDLPETHRLALYRAVQEGLTNVQRHAKASQAWLSLHQDPTGWEVRVADDGMGLGSNPPVLGERMETSHGYGLRGLYERASQLGGHAALNPRPDGGAVLSLWLPRV